MKQPYKTQGIKITSTTGKTHKNFLPTGVSQNITWRGK